MTNNMTVIKQSKIKLFIGWIVSHAVSIGLIGIGLALFLSSCSKASASSLPDNIEEILENDFDDHGYDYSDYSSYFIDIFSRDDLSVVRIRRSTNNILYYFYMYNGLQVRTNYSNGYFPYWGFDDYIMNVAPRGTTWDTSKVCYYALTITNSVVKLDAFKPHRSNYYDNLTLSLYSFPTYVPTNGDGAYGTSLGRSVTACNMHADYKTVVFNSSNNTFSNLYGIYDSDSIVCSSDFYYQGNGSTAFYKEANWETYYPSSVEDDRLKITTVNDIYGQKNLFIDIREFIDDFPISDTSGSSNWLDNDTLILTLVRDMIPEEVRLNASNSTIKSKYIFETPYSFFNVSENEELYISDVSFSISGSGQSVTLHTESYNILCEYWLNQIYTKPEQADIPKDSDVDGTKLSHVEYDKITNQVNFSDGYYSPLGGGGNELVVPYGYNVLYITITGSRTLASIINEIVTDNYLEIMLASGDPMTDIELSVYLAKEITSSITGITSTSDAENLIKEYIKNNYYTNMFDIVVYYWAPDSSLGEVDVMYYYLTESGRLRGISQILADVYRESNQISVNTKATYEFLYDKLNDFENMTLEAIWGDSPFSVFNSIDKLDNDMLSSVSRIIEAIPTFTPYDDHDVVYELGVLQGLLETIIENQDSPHDGYPKYISWVKNFDDLDGFGNWSESVLSTFKNIYSFFNYRQDINVMETGLQSYTYYVDEFVRMLLGNTESDLDVQKRYYMSIFDNTYDIHNINGGGT